MFGILRIFGTLLSVRSNVRYNTHIWYFIIGSFSCSVYYAYSVLYYRFVLMFGILRIFGALLSVRSNVRYNTHIRCFIIGSF